MKKYECPICKMKNLPLGNGKCVCSDVDLVEMAENIESSAKRFDVVDKNFFGDFGC